MNWKAAELLVAYRAELRMDVNDDVAIGRLLVGDLGLPSWAAGPGSTLRGTLSLPQSW